MKRRFTATVILALLTSASGELAFAAKGDDSRKPVCSSFAKFAVKWNSEARKLGCKTNTTEFNKTEAQYMDWCMNTSDASFRERSAQALGHKSNLTKFCQAQIGRHFYLD